ncbi:Uncharacterised protein [Raoultella planticola]|uniref:Uncharacterized protein n=1 Tax=Raoultella planticola TaxID=575 RepID=A0A485C0N2_RAOPL|nr:Uncharacterised protein [Raoultella planticola]
MIFICLWRPSSPFSSSHLAFRDTKLFGEEFNQMGVSLAIYGGSGNGDFQFVAM